LINAGHLPPFHISENSLKELSKGERALGLSERVTYKQQNIELGKGDILFVYSDGLTEALNNKEEFFESRLNQILPTLSHLSAEAGGEWIVDAVKKYIGTAKVHDDLSLLILKKK
jgi:sigma-B regulation protein RsbU (phosphoserine phosphatase)